MLTKLSVHSPISNSFPHLPSPQVHGGWSAGCRLKIMPRVRGYARRRWIWFLEGLKSGEASRYVWCCNQRRHGIETTKYTASCLASITFRTSRGFEAQWYPKTKPKIVRIGVYSMSTQGLISKGERHSNRKSVDWVSLDGIFGRKVGGFPDMHTLLSSAILVYLLLVQSPNICCSDERYVPPSTTNKK